MAEEISGGDGVYNQAAFQQARINEIFKKIDDCSIDMFAMEPMSGNWLYELIFNNLNTVLSIVSPKLTDDELSTLIKFKDIVRSNIEIRKIYDFNSSINFSGSSGAPTPNLKNRNKITDILFEYRIQIEKVMDIHNLSNPSRESEGGWD